MHLILATVTLMLATPLSAEQTVNFPNGPSLTGVCSTEPVEAAQYQATCNPAVQGIYLLNQTAFQDFQKNPTLFGASSTYYPSYSCIGMH